jgi:hypothetical protein
MVGPADMHGKTQTRKLQMYVTDGRVDTWMDVCPFSASHSDKSKHNTDCDSILQVCGIRRNRKQTDKSDWRLFIRTQIHATARQNVVPSQQMPATGKLYIKQTDRWHQLDLTSVLT